ncbi:hypothetical protein RZS08_46960, partial [Arthrospira platensis SPKY1]|nr:hypothetical protein [Arthrospira platensis SPKY1]
PGPEPPGQGPGPPPISPGPGPGPEPPGGVQPISPEGSGSQIGGPGGTASGPKVDPRNASTRTIFGKQKTLPPWAMQPTNPGVGGPDPGGNWGPGQGPISGLPFSPPGQAGISQTPSMPTHAFLG